MFAIRFYASNDPKGNERSVYLICDDEGLREPVASIEEWLVGALPSGLAEEFIARIKNIEVTPLEFQRLKRFKRLTIPNTHRRGPELPR